MIVVYVGGGKGAYHLLKGDKIINRSEMVLPSDNCL